MTTTKREQQRFSLNISKLIEETEAAAEHYRTQLDFISGRGVDVAEYKFSVKAEASALRHAERARQSLNKQIGGSREAFDRMVRDSGVALPDSFSASVCGLHLA
jgi:hypothetical protein